MEIYKGEKHYPVFQEPNANVTAVAFGVVRLSDGYYYDFADGVFKASGWTTQYQALTEASNGLWIYSDGWTTPNVEATYREQFKVTDDAGLFYPLGEAVQVTAVIPQVATVTASDTTASGLLAKVNSAIEAILDGKAVQSYTINGRSLARYPLGELMRMRARLQNEVASALSGGGARTYAEFAEPI